MLRARWLRWIRLAAACLSVLVAAGASLPAIARVLGGPPPHNCHCEVRGGHSHCGCPICVPELRETDDLGHGEMKGNCGDEDPGFRALSLRAIAAASFVLLPPLSRIETPQAPSLEPSQWARSPELPPPRSNLSTAFAS
ncbi:hypothetical protein AKJ09_09696 [Labilithrix luteola]|uniref:Uncharacterized protein n=1 Tax=Labilithrix luteola TaxID=1391654 RepID=A0A0K1QBC3_9BACT|nr:hypothetical protein [Labilithrix luteola]AKV03033.1 hypothetical protein AKJ09_09696 [Labilithrix luteola]